MIIRALRLRHGRFALPKSFNPSTSHSSHRTLASTTTSSPAFQSTPFTSSPDASQSGTNIREYEIRDPTSPVAQDFIFRQHEKARTQHVGSTLTPHYQPRELLTNPPRPRDITLELLMASQAHIGHATSLWNPANAKYIFGVRGKDDPIHVISLDITAAYLRRACKIVRGVAARGGLVLFVGTREGQARTVVKAAQLSGGCHLFTKWIPGSITNGQQILGNCGKKVVDENDVEVLGFGDQLERAAVLKPDLVVCLNPLENYILLHECALHNIPTIGIVDTDANPLWVTYPIPANDDSLRCVQVICGALGRAGEEGQEERLKNASEGVIQVLPDHGLEPPTRGQANREKDARERAALLAQQEYEAAMQFEEDERVAPAASEQNEESDINMDESEGGLEIVDSSLQLAEDGDATRFDLVDDAALQPYERDRPLSAEEMGEAVETASVLEDWRLEDVEDGESGSRS